MLYCVDSEGNFRKVSYGTLEQNLAFVADQPMARRMLRRLDVTTTGAVLVLVK